MTAQPPDAGKPHAILHPVGWPPPKGYADGIAASVPLQGGRLVFTAGQIGWDPATRALASGLASQTRQALGNVLAVLAQAHAGPEHLVRLTWYVTDLESYRSLQREIGAAYREIMGRHYPAMALVQVAGLVEPGALVEIEATAVVPA